MAMGLALALEVPPAVGLDEVEAVGLDESHCPGGKQVGNDTVGDDVDVVGCVGCVGELVVVLEVGADDVGAFVRWVLGGGGGGAGVWSVCLAATLAGGGNCSTGCPSRSAFITAAQVAVG
jgi:hypothetical protein